MVHMGVWSKQYWNLLAQALDVNKDGKLTFDEVLQKFFPLANPKELHVMLHWAYPTPHAPKPQLEKAFQLKEEQQVELRDLFTLYDTNKNGRLERTVRKTSSASIRQGSMAQHASCTAHTHYLVLDDACMVHYR